MAATLEPTPSNDVLFPEEDSQPTPSYSDYSASSYSTYSREVKYIFDPKFDTSNQKRYTENNNYQSLSDFSAGPRTNGHIDLNSSHESDSYMQHNNKSYNPHAITKNGYPPSEEVYSQPTTRHRFNNQQTKYPDKKINNRRENFGSQNSLYRVNEDGYQGNENSHHRGNYSDTETSPGSRRPIVGYFDNRKLEGSYLGNKWNAAEGRQRQPLPVSASCDALDRDPGMAPPACRDPRRVYRARHGYVNTADYNAAARRRTWSPPTFDKALKSVGGNFGNFPMRSYRSNDQLDVDVDNGNYYEEVDVVAGPPRLAPVSGQLNKTTTNSLVRPIAFKPVITPHTRYIKSQVPAGSREMRGGKHDPNETYSSTRDMDECFTSRDPRVDDGYVSQEYSTHPRSGSSASHGSTSHDVEPRRHLDRPESFNSSSHSQSDSHSHSDAHTGTPSPSDSGVELEAALKDKDAEIAALRATMEQNEAVIIGVYTERQHGWQAELREVADAWQARMRENQARAFRTEQALLLQLCKLQQDRKALRLDAETLKTQRERAESKSEELQREAAAQRARAEELSWELGQKAGELSLLKAQLRDAKEESTNRANDLLGVRSQLRESQRDLQVAHTELSKAREQLKLYSQKSVCDQSQQTEPQIPSPSSSPSLSCSRSPGANNNSRSSSTSDFDEIARLRTELDLLRCDQEKTRLDFEKERENWLEEKNKVIQYQKHLQLNYVQMFRKNQRLESEIEQLMLEAENREIKLTTSSGIRKPSTSQEEALESTC